MTPAGASNELDVHNEWEQNTPEVLLVRFLEAHVTHVYNGQMDSVFSDPEIRQFGKKNLERLTIEILLPNFKFSKTSEIEKRRSSKLFLKVRKLLRALRFGAVVFQTFSDFQICVAPAHKGGIRVVYAVLQVALNSRGSLDIGWKMADRRKHGAPSGLVPSSRPR